MQPIDFDGSNCVYAENQSEYLSLPAYEHGDEFGSVTGCWALTFWERIKLLLRGKVYVSLATFGKPLSPHRLDIDRPF